MKKSEKVIFIFVVIVAVFFIRMLYPSFSIPPQSATADISQTAITQSNPPLLVLPTISAINNPNNASGNNNNSSTGNSSSSAAVINSIFSRVDQNSMTPVPTFKREAYMITDLTTGAVLSGSNTASRWPTASLTKLMTATIVLDNISTSTVITITPQMFAADPEEATLAIGDTYTVEDLLHLMLMPSSNVAAEAMADYFGRQKFMQDMNTRAQEWGMQSTYFDDPSGISAANESTANDLLILAQHVYNNYPTILAITNTPSTTITETNTRKTIPVTSINNFAGEPNFIGGKTGHTSQAGGNLLSIFTYDGHPVLIIVLNTTDRFGDTSKLFAWFKTNFK